MAIRTLAPYFEHKLFLSATPHNGYKESFSALLELLDNQRFAQSRSAKPCTARRDHGAADEIRSWSCAGTAPADSPNGA